MEKGKKNLPWDEIVDRLYHRQEPSDIIEDLNKRGIINEDEEDKEYVKDLIEGMKGKIDSYRLGKNT
jgi:polyhydroxyalkanoate synthesis regulator phasin